MWVLGVHAIARRIYRATGGHRAAQGKAELNSFYSSLLPNDVLAFDIGANTGQYADALESAGARVIAIEPNPDCVRHIELSYSSRRIQAIQAAVAARNGLAEIKISDKRDDISTLSTAWMTTLKSHHDEYLNLWNRVIVVPIVTLDSLIEHYGVPHYIKIDVEGFEEAALDGLSVQPHLLSFEFNLASLKTALVCLDKLNFSGNSSFNFVWGARPSEFQLPNWLGLKEFKEMLCSLETSLGARDRHGDIFVKRLT
jgi:FkbM family methyltransferase